MRTIRSTNTRAMRGMKPWAWCCVVAGRWTRALERNSRSDWPGRFLALLAGRLLLLVQDCVEHGLFDFRFDLAALGIDERVETAALKLRVFFLQVVLGRMISEGYVAGQRAH